jgi:hypothetical protein
MTARRARRPDLRGISPADGQPSAAQHPSARSGQDEPVDSRMSRVAARAHQLYEARGGENGKALEDWLQAERDVDGERDSKKESL